jgi:Na+/H+ antiporter NhaC
MGKINIDNENSTLGGLPQFSPLIIFFTIYVLLSLYVAYVPEISALDLSTIRYSLPIFSAFIAGIFSLFTFVKKTALHRKIEIFISGSSNISILYIYYIFIFSTAFSYILDKNGGIHSAVNLGLTYLPVAYILPGIFIVVSIFALSIGSSLGSIAAIMPIAYGIAQTLTINPALMAAIVVSGAMLGDNLSMISSTTIVATKVTGSSMRDKFKDNLIVAFPAFLVTVLYLCYLAKTSATITAIPEGYIQEITTLDYINIIPYALIFALAMLGVDVLAVLAIAALLASAIGILHGNFSFLEATAFIFEGFYGQKSMVRIIVLFLFISGLSQVVTHNGGFDYILNKLKNQAKNSQQAQLLIIFLTIAVNAAIAINTLAIILTGPIAKEIGDQFNIPRGRVACLLDVAATSTQGFLPYAPMMILASSLSHSSVLEIMKNLTYQPLLFASMIASVFIFKYKKESTD